MVVQFLLRTQVAIADLAFKSQPFVLYSHMMTEILLMKIKPWAFIKWTLKSVPLLFMNFSVKF
jgi:hypothetical protein